MIANTTYAARFRITQLTVSSSSQRDRKNSPIRKPPLSAICTARVPRMSSSSS